MQHEAGHFLVGYLLSALPKRYVVSKMEALMQNEFVGGGVEFMGFEFLGEVSVCCHLLCLSLALKIIVNG